jgi:hypothetical protein
MSSEEEFWQSRALAMRVALAALTDAIDDPFSRGFIRVLDEIEATGLLAPSDRLAGSFDREFAPPRP